MAKETGGWSSSWDSDTSTDADKNILLEGKDRFTDGINWLAQALLNFEYDYKFANGDTHNKYQWDDALVEQRDAEGRPCLTINKTNVHNLMVINDAKQNKPGIRIRPVGDEATYEAASAYQEIIYHIEYISSAENVYDWATTFQVQAGWGYWRVATDYVSADSFDQEIYIRRIKDPRSVVLDPNITEVDGSDARYGFIFDEMPKDLFAAKFPKYKDIATRTNWNINVEGWVSYKNVKVLEYFRKTDNEDTLITYTLSDTGQQVLKKVSELSDTEKLIYQELKSSKPEVKAMYKFRQRKIIEDKIEWFKIAGDQIIDRGIWPGKYIPIVRLPGTETVIDGIYDCKGHTRSLINAQQMYNYNTSASVEYGALQTKAPWIAPMDAIEGFEEIYKTANNVNHSFIPYNHIGDDGEVIPPPTRPAPPQASPAYIKQMEISQNEMMMATGQYQAQLGENENAKSGVAINARQRQGDRATYHFIDNQAIAIRFTGKILLDLIPKIYDTKRLMRITGADGKIMDMTIDPEAQQPYQKLEDRSISDKGQIVEQIILNPTLGQYDVQSDTGPSFATRRMEAVAAMTQIAIGDKEFLKWAGDVYFGMMDFPKADVLADRAKKMLPPNLSDPNALPPQVEELMHQSADHIQQLTAENVELKRQVQDKSKDLTQKGQKLDLDFKRESAVQAREDYKAETDRLVAIFNTAADGEGMDPSLKKIFQQLAAGIAKNGEPEETNNVGSQDQEGEEQPPVPGARKAPDGNWYTEKDGQFFKVETNGAAA